MRLAMALVLAVGLGGAANALECPEGSPEPLIPFNWEYTPDGSVMVAVRNTFDKEVRMVDAEVFFVDGLGRAVGEQPLPVDPDLAIFPLKANFYHTPAPRGYDRLALADLEDYEVTMCTRAILFKDGTKATFTD